MRNIGTIRKLITSEATNTLVRALVLSRLDYCNSLFYNVNKDLLQKLQRIQNSAARMTTRCTKYSHITPHLMSLHWLPVQARIEFKVLSITYQCYHNSAPEYLTELIKHYTPARSLRSNSKYLLTVPSLKLKSCGQRSFKFGSAYLWNQLPLELKLSSTLSVFKSRLKTHLFQKYYNSHL